MRKPVPAWVDCVVWLFLGWLAGLAAALLAQMVLSRADPGGFARGLLRISPNVAGAGVVVLLGLSRAGAPAARVLSLRAPVPWVVLSSIALALLAAAINTWLDRLLPMPEAIQELFRGILTYRTVSEFFGVFSFLIVVAPVTEELMFRGLFLHRLTEAYGTVPGIVGSAICFGVFHILPWQVVGAVIAGGYLGWLVARTGSVYLAMAAHAVFNLVPVVATGIGERFPAVGGLGANPAAEPFRPSPFFLLIASALFLAGLAGTLRAGRVRETA
jgi:membrane protease YdiL (CAAX protease family)